MTGHEEVNWVPRLANPDQEVWVKQRILTAIHMALAVRRERRVQADGAIYANAIDGIAEGAAIEVIQTLGLKPGFVNLKRVDS